MVPLFPSAACARGNFASVIFGLRPTVAASGVREIFWAPRQGDFVGQTAPGPLRDPPQALQLNDVAVVWAV
jgi:hypothetical protein